jgi:chemotaxis protein methyltransferase CheR
MTHGDHRPPARDFAFSNNVFSLTEPAFALLRDLIVERTGVLFDTAKRGLLADKLSELVAANGLTSFIDYYYLLRFDADAEAHWAALMDRLAVPETFFWRQAEQLQAFAKILAPMHFERHPTRPLRVWSAACCTGEEPLSLALALSEAGLLHTRKVQIYATDGSRAMIDRARRGLYGDRSFRQLPEELKQKYFTPADRGLWQPKAELREPITWDVVNLASPDETRPFASCDVIFCRNVFIYFSDNATRRVVQHFANHMPADGSLFVGASESLNRFDVDFELAEIAGAFLYVKHGQRARVEASALPKRHGAV